MHVKTEDKMLARIGAKVHARSDVMSETKRA